MNAQAQALLNRTEYLNGFAARNNTYTKAQRGAFVAFPSPTSSEVAEDAFTLTPPALSHMKYQIGNTEALILWREVTTGIPTDLETYSFSAYATVGELVDAVNASALGWSATLIAPAWKLNTDSYAGNGIALISEPTTIEMNPPIVILDMNASNNFYMTLTENTEIGTPTDAVAGQTGVLHFTQGASSPFTLNFSGFWYFGATTPTISATLEAVCAVSYVIEPGATRAICSMGGDLA